MDYSHTKNKDRVLYEDGVSNTKIALFNLLNSSKITHTYKNRMTPKSVIYNENLGLVFTSRDKNVLLYEFSGRSNYFSTDAFFKPGKNKQTKKQTKYGEKRKP